MARRIVSFLPSATEMAFSLGLGDQLLGVSHECDYPRAVREKPIVVRSVLPVERMSQQEIDTAVTERLRKGLSLYQVDESLMQDLAPGPDPDARPLSGLRALGTKSRSY
jgi:iron complex transport system substrate-binding protein